MRGSGPTRKQRRSEGTMNKRRLIPILAVSAWLASGVGLAQGQTVFPVSTTAPFAPNTGSNVTVTLGTANWLPSPGATVTLTVKVGGVTNSGAVIQLVCPDGTLTLTSCP